ncbi:ZIP family metal transporter [Candidatus Micrarchaeota archaeon]|nr:ZIP family metal transporter [Candidatus Micrarchaeota archaeon]
MLLEIVLATVFVSLLSFSGIILLSLQKKTQDALVFIILGFATGSLLAAAFFDLLPEAITGLPSGSVFAFTLAGIMVFFILESMVHWHHEHHDHKEHEKPVAYLVLIGDGIHNFFDGVAIAAGFLVSLPLGLATTFAIMMHEIPQEISDFTLLTYAGFSTKKALIANLLSGLTSVLGALFFFYLSGYVQNLQFYGLAFAAGGFIYIAASDLIPELHKQGKMRVWVQLAAILAGIAVMWLLANNAPA